MLEAVEKSFLISSIPYLYGLGRIEEEQPGGFVLQLGDAPDSVRQVLDWMREVTLARDYEPYQEFITRNL